MKHALGLVLALLLSACTTVPTRLQIAWAGTYELVDKTLIANRRSPTLVSLATEVSGKPAVTKRIQETTRIYPKVGYGFGIAFRVAAQDQGNLNVVVHLPQPGLLDRRTGQMIIDAEWPPYCSVDTCMAAYNFEHESEFIPGQWRIEVWRQGELLLAQEFTLAQ